MSIDYYPTLGVHQGFMPFFAEQSGLSLECLLLYHLKKNNVNEVKFKGLSKTDRLLLLQEGVELIRPHIDLSILAGIEPESNTGFVASKDNLPQSENDEKWKELYSFVKNKYFTDDGLIIPELFFELMEWNCSGTAVFEVHKILIDFLIPDSYLIFLSQLIQDDEKIQRSYLTNKDEIKSSLQLLNREDFKIKLFKKLMEVE